MCTQQVRATIAAELERCRELLETFGAALGTDPNIMTIYIEELQGLDRVGQELLALSGLLRATSLDGGIAAVPLDDLRRRLCDSLHP